MPIEGRAPISSSRSVNRTDVNCDAGVGVCDEPDEAAAAAGPSRHLERVEDHVGAHVRSDTPADDPPGERVDDEAHVGHPGPRRHVGEVGDPQGVGPLGGEVPVDEVRCPHRVRVGPGGEHLATPTADPFDCHLRASGGRPGPGRCRGRPGGPPSTACGPRRPCGWRPTTPSTPASAPRRGPPGPTADGTWRRSTCSERSAAPGRSARPRTRHDGRR